MMQRHTTLQRKTPLRAKKPMARSREKRGPGLAQRIAESLGRAIQHAHSAPSVYRSRGHRQIVASLPCACCGLEKHSQAAHLNLLALGKGRGWKVSDSLTVPLCCARPGVMGCHIRLDSSGQYDKATSETLQIAWLQDTRHKLIQMKKWPPEAEADVTRFLGEYLKRAA